MNRIEKIEALIKAGIKCDTATGRVYGKRGHEYLSRNKGYIQINTTIDGKLCRAFAHQLIYYTHYGTIPDIIDHINQDITDNRIENLRESTRQQNALNTDAKGYTELKNKQGSIRFQAQIKINGKNEYIGCFNTKDEAHAAYLDRKSKILQL